MNDFNSNSVQNRVELHLHTNMSAMDAVSPAADLIRRVCAWGHKAVAITDHGNIQAFPEVMNTIEELRKAGKNIKPIYGMEAYFVNDSDGTDFKKLPIFHIIILVKNKQGLKNLYKLVSLSQTKYFNRNPIITMSELQNHREGLIIGSACGKGEIFHAVLENKPQEYIKKIAEIYDYFEIQPVENNKPLIKEGKVSGEEELHKINMRISELADKLGKPCAVTGDVHYKSSEGVIWRAVIQSALGRKDADEQPALFFHNTKAMLSEFNYLGEEKAYEVVIANTNAIADMVEDNIRPIPEGKFLPHSSGDEKKLRDICELKARKIYGDKLPEIVKKRLDTELDRIAEKGLSDIFLSVIKIVNFSKSSGYPVCAVGTVGSSFAAFLAGISEINPLPPHYRCGKCCYSEFITDSSVYSGYDMPPKFCPNCKTEMIRGGFNIFSEAFFGNKKDFLPHIYLFFSEDIFENVLHRIGEIFGKNNIISVGKIITVNEKSARIFWKNYCDKHGIQPSPAETERFIYCCTRVKASDSCSPGSVFIIPREYDICDFTPVQQTGYLRKYDRTASHFDSSALHKTLFKMGLYKYCIPTLYGRLEKLTGIKITAVPINDPEIFNLFNSGGTLGIPGFGTEFEMKMLDTVKPKCFSDLIKISGLSHGTGTWLNNARELIQNGTCTLSEVIATRDDIMIYLMKKGIDRQTAFNIAEAIGRGKSNDEIYKKLAAHGVPEWYIESCKKIKHLLPKAHAAEYAMAAARLAWYKLYKPAEFYAAVISRHISIEYETILNGKSAVKQRLTELAEKADITLGERDIANVLQLVYEMMMRGITVIPMSDKSSDTKAFVIKNGNTEVSFPLLNSIVPD